MPYNLTFYKISEKYPLNNSEICVLRERGGGITLSHLSLETHKVEYFWEAINDDDCDEQSVYWMSDGLYDPGDIDKTGRFILSVYFDGQKLEDDCLWCYINDIDELFNDSQGCLIPPVYPDTWSDYYHSGKLKVKQILNTRDFKWTEGVHEDYQKPLEGRLMFCYFIAEYKNKDFKMSMQYDKVKKEILYLSILDGNNQ